MNRIVRWGFALATLPLAACAGSPPPAAPAVPAGPPPLAAADAAFINTAAQGDLGEMQAAQLAQKTSHNPKVTAYAGKMIGDHTQFDTQLKQIATAKGATLPTAPSDADTQQLTALQHLTGHGFDHQYIADQVMDHQQMLQAYQAEAQAGTDPDVKAFAASGVTVVQSHLDMATALQKPAATHKAHHRRKAS